MSQLTHVRQCSQYLDILVRNNPDYAEWLIDDGNIGRKFPLTTLYSDLQHAVGAAGSFNDFLRIYRRFKQLHFLRIGSRDLLGKADLAETTGQLSDLASVALQIGLETLSSNPGLWASEEDARTWEQIRGESTLTVLGLGKLGGHELNYVSDIDIIFLHSDNDSDDTGRHLILLSRMVHWLSRLLADRYEGDRVFQVDFRLRPQGKDGMLVPSMSAAVEHYLLHGRAWERQMLLKCRPVAGDRSAGNAFVREVRPFVYRRFLDFQALGELRDMRNMILTESRRFGPGSRQFDVKLGIGGIREIEFLVQSMQLIYGGRHLELDEPNTLKCLKKLGQIGLFPESRTIELADSYNFLRRVEHYVQLDQNRQTQKLPQSEDARRRLILALGLRDGKAFNDTLEEHCSRVNATFSSLFAAVSDEEEDYAGGGQGGAGRSAGTRKSDLLPKASAGRLQETLKPYPGSIGAMVFGIVESLADRADSEILEKVLVRLDTYFSTVGKRPGLKKLFSSASPWLSSLCGAISSSELVSGLLAHNPGLVEGLAISQTGYVPAVQWHDSSARLLERSDDYEEKLEWMRRLKNERILQLIISDLKAEIDFSALEEELSALADFVLGHTLETVKCNLGLPADLPLSVLGMGKLGSREMSYQSDLDLVFIYQPQTGESGNQIPGPVVRLIQRFMNMLNIPLHEGPGYAVDARLRPTGNYGPLVVTSNAWLDYYKKQADIWEIQALLRARHVAGDASLGRWVEDQAGGICHVRRDSDEVWPRICHLRDRMEKERSEETEGTINLKLGIGGLADIEFLAQGIQLVKGERELAARSRSVRRTVREILPNTPEASGNAAIIDGAFRALRAVDHRLRLYANSSSGKMEKPHFEAMKALGLWPPKSDSGSIETWEDLLRVRREVRTIFRIFCKG
ncbi:MAG: hypothetical protein ABFD97_04130 [Syntrophobacter sp.]